MRPRVVAAALAWLAVLAGPAAAAEFAPPRWGLTAVLPEGWTAAEPQPFVLLVLPPETVPLAGSITLSLRNLPAADGAGPASYAARLGEELRTQASDGAVERDSAFRWDIGDGIVMGRQLVGTFAVRGAAFRQWTVFLPSPHAPVVHMWQYTAPQSAFASHLPAARAMLDSLSPRAPDE